MNVRNIFDQQVVSITIKLFQSVRNSVSYVVRKAVLHQLLFPMKMIALFIHFIRLLINVNKGYLSYKTNANLLSSNVIHE